MSRSRIALRCTVTRSINTRRVSPTSEKRERALEACRCATFTHMILGFFTHAPFFCFRFINFQLPIALAPLLQYFTFHLYLIPLCTLGPLEDPRSEDKEEHPLRLSVDKACIGVQNRLQPSKLMSSNPAQQGEAVNKPRMRYGGHHCLSRPYIFVWLWFMLANRVRDACTPDAISLSCFSPLFSCEAEVSSRPGDRSRSEEVEVQGRQQGGVGLRS